MNIKKYVILILILVANLQSLGTGRVIREIRQGIVAKVPLLMYISVIVDYSFSNISIEFFESFSTLNDLERGFNMVTSKRKLGTKMYRNIGDIVQILRLNIVSKSQDNKLYLKYKEQYPYKYIGHSRK